MYESGVKVRLVVAGVVSGVLLAAVCRGVSRNGNLEYWQEQTISIDLDEKWMIYGTEEFRMGRAKREPYLHNVDMGVVRRVADWLDLGVSFKKEYEIGAKGKYRKENRPHFNIILTGNLGQVATSNRIRLEYRNKENSEDYWRLRNQTSFKFPAKLTALELQPFIAEEWFVHLGENNIDQNRLSAGLSYAITKNIKSSIYYMWKANRGSGGWVNTNVVGTSFNILFK